MTRTTIALVLALGACACASAPPAPPSRPAEPSFEQKMSWILRLEDSRILHDPQPEAPPPPPVPPRGRVAVATPPPPPVPDLVRMLTDSEARIRRRAALAIGRVGLADGVLPLAALLRDSDPEVRQMAAFALGLIGDRRASEPLIAALQDPAAVVTGSAAEALGLLGDAAAAGPLARLASGLVAAGALAQLPPDELEAARDTPAAAFRLAVFALARLKAYDALASVVLDPSGQPRVRWWPVAFALQRLEDPRGLAALVALLKDPHPYTRAFAAKGLGAIKDRQAVQALLPLVTDAERTLAIEAVRSLGRIGDPAAAPPLMKLAQTTKTEPHIRLEAVTALGALRADGVYDALIDILGDPSPVIRGAAIRSMAQLDPDGFITVLSGLDPDPHWTVRVALATALGGLSADAGLPRLRSMLGDQEPKVLPAVLASMARLRPADAGTIAIDQLRSGDPVVRAAAAAAIAELKPVAGPAALTDAYQRSLGDTTYVARAAVLAALKAYGRETALPLLTDALADKDWALRLRAAALLGELDPASDATLRIRPVPNLHPPEWYARVSLATPPVSTHVYVDTDRGTIQIELAVLDAPITVDTFVSLARAGFFDGLPIHRVVPDFVIQGGDPRGDGEGGPGYTIRNEINQRPYLRGAVGLALDWADTGGSQFFITHSPQPHLDGRYTVFGRVVSGMDVVDAIEPWDVIRRVRVWDGSTD
ncbi:MAG TPA: HEAT repeat domain-containing protein [Vicinamibacterales bacterium]|nr:HEAT repeat domain-containing protein [Vicinamibacterales bacterium]